MVTADGSGEFQAAVAAVQVIVQRDLGGNPVVAGGNVTATPVHGRKDIIKMSVDLFFCGSKDTFFNAAAHDPVRKFQLQTPY